MERQKEEKMERVNYHTHTYRCRHAGGTERGFIEEALSAGIKELGFSDHVPQPYESDFISGIRMHMEELPGYVDTLLRLREEYRGRIRILIGFEVEYVPEMFDELMRILEAYPVDYLIVGQHFLDRNDERAGLFCSRETQDEKRLARYVDQILEGLGTGKFAFLAHPDIFHFTGDAGIYGEQMGRLCQGCKRMGIPLEINRLGFFEQRHYPRADFWRIAAKTGNEVIIGYDAHQPGVLSDEETYRRCKRWAEGLGIRPNEQFRICC